MCISPVKVPNPVYHARYVSDFYRKTHDTQSLYIQVPCRQCDECISSMQSNIVTRCKIEGLDNHIFYATLTYDQKHLPHFLTSSGYNIPYADINHLQTVFKYLRKHNLFDRPFRYFGVSERGSQRGRPHFHVMFFLPKLKSDNRFVIDTLENKLYWSLRNNWRINIGSCFKPVWEPLFTYAEKYVSGILYRNYDLHYVDPNTTTDGSADVAFYISKYMLKPNDKERKLYHAFRLNLEESEFIRSWNIVRSKSFASVNLGFNTDIEKCKVLSDIESSYRNPEGPVIYDPHSGKPIPLPCYYWKYLTPHQYETVINNLGGPIRILEDRPFSEIAEIIRRRELRLSNVNSRDNSLIQNLLDNVSNDDWSLGPA